MNKLFLQKIKILLRKQHINNSLQFLLIPVLSFIIYTINLKYYCYYRLSRESKIYFIRMK